jgi:hypothetical protein
MTMKDIEIKYQPLEPTAFFSDKTEDEWISRTLQPDSQGSTW